MNNLITFTDNIENKFFKFLITGESGIGKTSLAKTLPHNEVLLLSFENGELPLSDSKIAVIKFNDISKPADRYKRLQEVYLELQKPEYKARFKHVIIDSITELSGVIQDAVFAQFPDVKDTQRTWGLYDKQIRGIVKSFRDIDYNVFFLALPKVEKDEIGRRFTSVSMKGSVRDEITAYFDFAFHYIFSKDEKRILVTAGDSTFEAKDRSGALDKFEEPNLSNILNKIKAKKIKKEEKKEDKANGK